MGVQMEAIAKLCREVTRQISDRFKNLTIHYVIHHEGQRADALGLAGQEIINHPAAETALHLLARAHHAEDNALIGMAVARKNLLFGLASQDSILALSSINIDQHNSLYEVRRQAYHAAWHAIDGYKYNNSLSGQQTASREIIVRRRNALEMAAANLRADMFSATMCRLQGDHECTRETAVLRGVNSLHSQGTHNPEYYPFLIAMESAELALSQLPGGTVHKRKYIDTALRIAEDVGKTYDKEALKLWLGFSEPAQDMAWRGFSSESILSAAINTSNDTQIRATAFMVSEITGIKPASILEINDNYSAFADDAFNESVHNKAIDEIFEDVIAEGLRYSSVAPFMNAAHEQNKLLMDGKVTGWCAAALQSSGRAFDNALKNNSGAEIAARKEFEGERNKTNWNGLKGLSDKIIARHKQGEFTGMSDIAEMCKGDLQLQAVRRSVDMTIKDPAYQRSLRQTVAPAPDPSPHVAPRAAQPAAAPRLGRKPDAGIIRRKTAQGGNKGSGEGKAGAADQQ